MKLPKIIIHNSITLEGSVSGFEVDMELHYLLAGGYGAGAHLVGSNTIKSGIEMFGTVIPPEEESDFTRPENEGLPYWIIPDTRGSLRGVLHYLRRSGFCRDAILLLSETTTRAYRDYLEQRSYDYLIAGKEHVDLRLALGMVGEKYAIDVIMVDAGPTLNGVLLANGLVDEINLIVAPYLTGTKSDSLFSKLGLINNIELELLHCREINKSTVLLSYRVKKEFPASG